MESKNDDAANGRYNNKNKKIKNFQEFSKKVLDTSCTIPKKVYAVTLMNVDSFTDAVVIRLMKTIF